MIAYSERRHDYRWFARHIDVSLIIAVVAVSVFGVLMIYSSTWRFLQDVQLSDPQFFARRQSLFVAVGLVVMVVVLLIDYRHYKAAAWPLYVLVLGSLVAVLTFGHEVNGARAWFQFGTLQVQPAEFAKIVIVVALAAYAARHGGALRLRPLLIGIAIAALPMVLIYRQPDVGTMLVFIAIIMGTLLVAGAQGRHIIAFTILGVAAIVIAMGLDVLTDVQEQRLTAFLDQEADAQTVNYNLDQSMIAIGSGGLTGKGYLEGPQTNLDLVPEQHTDFIFTAVGEEFGFIGAAALLLLYGFICWRIWLAARRSADLFGTLACVGVLSILVFQIFQNVGMTMGIMPITGLPLPFMSHGGSSTIVAFAAVGLVLNVNSRRLGRETTYHPG